VTQTTRSASVSASNAAARGSGRRRTSGDTQYLEWHGGDGGQWRVVVYVPRHLRAIIGKAALRRGLKTQDLRTAQTRRWTVIKEFKEQIAEAEAKASGSTHNPITSAALEWRKDIQIVKAIADAPYDDADAEVLAGTLSHIGEMIESAAEQIERDHGSLKAREFVNIASGKRTPLDMYLEQWLKENGRKNRRTLGDYRRSVSSLLVFAEKSGRSPTLETFSVRRPAWEYATYLADRGMHPRTLNKYISGLSSYWRWMLRKGLASENPWRDQALPKADTHQADKRKRKRAFTDDELSRLLHVGKPDRLLHEFMLIAALSGMRINEIAWIKARDVHPLQFTIEIPTAKTEAGIRLVPIHSKLKRIILDRLVGKAPDDWLFPELPEQTKSRESERYMPVSKYFGRYRQDLGVHEKDEGQRQSRVDFHSFRRWFVTKVQRTNMPRDVIKAIVGHKDGSVTFDLYAGGPSLKQFRAVVEAVKLPKAQPSVRK
jgi:site-specific recombinase XerD